MWTHLASLSLSSVVHNGVVVLKSTESHPALKFLIPCILYSLSDHELHPAMWKHSLTTNFPDSCLPGWSTRVVHEGPPLQVPEVMEINNPLLKADLHRGKRCWNPTQASEVTKYLGGLQQARVLGPGSGAALQWTVTTLMFVILLDILSLTPVSPRPCEKHFLMFVFVVGHECFFYNDTKINKKDKTGNYALKKVFCLKSSQGTFRRQVYHWSAIVGKRKNGGLLSDW